MVMIHMGIHTGGKLFAKSFPCQCYTLVILTGRKLLTKGFLW